MAISASASASLSVTVAHAIAYITRPLIIRYPATTVLKLQLALEVNLMSHYSSSWVPTEPLRGSGRRCLTLSPNAIPPRPIYASCAAAKVQWSEWIAALGGLEFDLFVDPGCVSVRSGKWGKGEAGKLITVWSDELAAVVKEKADILAREALLQAQIRAQETARAIMQPTSKTFAQQLLQDDEEEEEELFAMIADEIREPTWMTPVLSQFPAVPAAAKFTSPPSTISSHSRSSSRSSDSSSDFSFSSDTSDSVSSVTTISSSATEKSKLSRRERARQARVYVDTTKTEVTNYDGGKTTVLTGGVMLGARSGAPKPIISATKPRLPQSSSTNWRSIRA